MQRLSRGVTVGFESDEGDDEVGMSEESPIPLSISIRRDDLIAAIDEMASGQYTIEEYLNEKAEFGPKIRIVD